MLDRMEKIACWLENHPTCFLAIVFFTVFLPALHVLRIVQDDWSVVFDEFARLSKLNAWEAFARIFTNQWYPHPRVYWVSWTLNWISHRLALGAFGLWGPGHFLPILALHFFTTTLVYKALRHSLDDRRLALVSATLCLIYPGAAAALFMITNWFFVIPLFFVALLVNLAQNPRRNRFLDILTLTTTALVGQFSGEQTIPLIYFVLLWFFLKDVRGGRRIAFEFAQVRLLVPGIICLAALAAYYPLFMKPYTVALTSSKFAWAVLPGYFLHYLKLLILPLYPPGVFYGRFSVPPSWMTIVFSGVLFLVAGAAWAHENEETAETNQNRFYVLLFLGIGIVLTAIPCLYGALNGYRPVPELRYTYAPGLLFAALIPPAISLVFERSLPARLRIGKRWIPVVLTTYMGSLMLYQMREIWGTQKQIDRRIWSAIDAAISSGDRALVAHNPGSRYLMPAWFSAAPSDFKCNYCIRDRLLIARGVELSEVRSELISMPSDAASLGGKNNEKEGVLTVVFRHGPRFSDLMKGQISVSRNPVAAARVQQ